MGVLDLRGLLSLVTRRPNHQFRHLTRHRSHQTSLVGLGGGYPLEELIEPAQSLVDTHLVGTQGSYAFWCRVLAKNSGLLLLVYVHGGYDYPQLLVGPPLDR